MYRLDPEEIYSLVLEKESDLLRKIFDSGGFYSFTLNYLVIPQITDWFPVEELKFSLRVMGILLDFSVWNLAHPKGGPMTDLSLRNLDGETKISIKMDRHQQRVKELFGDAAKEDMLAFMLGKK